MKLYFNKTSSLGVKAVQWHKEGDHPIVAAYSTTPPNSPLAADEESCHYCSKKLKEHGLIPGSIHGAICPGSFLLFGLDGAFTCWLSSQSFYQSYEDYRAVPQKREQTDIHTLLERTAEKAVERGWDERKLQDRLYAFFEAAQAKAKERGQI